VGKRVTLQKQITFIRYAQSQNV